MVKAEDDLEQILKAKLQEKESELNLKEAELEPLREEVKKIRGMLRDYTKGAIGSASVGDDQIVAWIKRHASQASPVKAPEVAAGLGIDTRGISRRLPRMARENLITGNAEDGYYVASRMRRPVAGAAV